MRFIYFVCAFILLVAIAPVGQGQYQGVLPTPNELLPDKAVLRYGMARMPHGAIWASFSACGDYFVCNLPAKLPGTKTGTVVVCESETGRVAYQVPHREGESLANWVLPSVQPYVFVASRKGLVSGYNVLTQKKVVEVQSKNSEPANYLALCPKNQILATAGNSELCLWDVATGEIRHCLKPQSTVTELCFLPNGKILVCGDRAGSVFFVDVATGKVVKQLALFAQHQDSDELYPPGLISELACTSDGTMLAIRAFSGEVVLYSLGSGKEIRRTKPNELRRIVEMLFLPDDSTLLLFSDQKIHCWSSKFGEEVDHPLARIRYSTAIIRAACSVDGKKVYTLEKEMGARIWEVATGRELTPSDQHRGSLTAIDIAPQGDRVATASWDGTVRLWDAKTAERLATLDDTVKVVYSLTFLGDGKRVATGSSDPTIRVWENSKVVARLEGHHGAVLALAATTDGKTLVSGGRDASLRLWNLTTNKAEKTQVTSAPIRQLAVSSDGQVVAAFDENKQILLWYPATGKSRSIVSPDKTTLKGLALSPSGHLLFGKDGRLRVWDTSTGQHLATVELPGGGGSLLTLLNDRLVVVSASRSGCVVDWPTGRTQLLHDFGSDVHGLAASMNPPRLYTAHTNALGYAWDLTEAVNALKSAAPPEKVPLSETWKRLADTNSVGWPELCQLLQDEKTTVFLTEKLPPIAGVPEKELAALLTQLEDDDFDKREKAATRLAEIGEAALPAMKKRLEAPAGADLKNHLLELIRKAEEISPERLRAIRAVLALEMIGTPAARELLGKLAKGDSSARLTRDAIAALKRLDKR